MTILAFAAPRAHATQVLAGDPSCDGAGNCLIDNIDPVTNPVADETYEIVLRNMQHIEIFDTDGFTTKVFFAVSNPNTNQNELTVTLDYGFSDQNGDPTGPVVDGFTTPLLPGEGVGNAVLLVDAPEGGSFVFHDFEIFLTCDGCSSSEVLNTSEISSIEISGVDATSRVGVWVPEPSAFALLGMSIVSLLAADRRKRS